MLTPDELLSLKVYDCPSDYHKALIKQMIKEYEWLNWFERLHELD